MVCARQLRISGVHSLPHQSVPQRIAECVVLLLQNERRRFLRGAGHLRVRGGRGERRSEKKVLRVCWRAFLKEVECDWEGGMRLRHAPAGASVPARIPSPLSPLSRKMRSARLTAPRDWEEGVLEGWWAQAIAKNKHRTLLFNKTTPLWLNKQLYHSAKRRKRSRPSPAAIQRNASSGPVPHTLRPFPTLHPTPAAQRSQ